MKTMIAALALVLAISGCGAKPSVKAAAKKKTTRIVVVDRARVDGMVSSTVLRDTKTDSEYLVVSQYRGGVSVTPLLGSVEETQ